MVKVLLLFSQVHREFRVPEFESICAIMNVSLNEQNLAFEKHLHVIEIEDMSEIKKVLSRSMLLKSAYEIYGECASHEELIAQMRKRTHVFEEFNTSSSSWALRFSSYGKKRNNEYKSELLEKYADFMVLENAPINLKNPTNEFHVVEENEGDVIKRVYFCRLIGEGCGLLKVHYDIKKRKYIGNSTMDPELSFIQANLALCNSDAFVLDPFCGTGGLLLAASHFGSLSLGMEISYQVARAVGKSSRTGEKILRSDQSILANFQQYNLEDKFVDVLLADSSRDEIWRLDASCPTTSGIFDAIVTDPPYGIREKGQKVGLKPISYERSETVTKEYDDVRRYPSKTSYAISSVYLDLLDLAVKLLRIGGRLTFWFPVFRNEYSEKILPQHECMQKIYNCEQILTRESSRRLLVYEKKSAHNGEKRAFFDVDCYESESFRSKIFNLNNNDNL